MIRITRETDYGIVLLARLAADPRPGPRTAPSLAAQSRLPVAMVAKILKRLTRGGILVSERGVKGGYQLAREPDEITVPDMITALEGPIAVTECVGPHGECDHECWCQVHPSWKVINTAILGALETITLTDMATPLGRVPDACAVALHSLRGAALSKKEKP